MIDKLSWPHISSLLLDCRNKIRLVLPAIHEEWSMLIAKVIQKGVVNVKVCINNSEKYIRDGFGDEKAIKLLSDLNVEMVETVKQSYIFYFS